MRDLIGRDLLRGLYQEQLAECREYIKLAKDWISTLNRIREKYPDNWKIVEACRELIFYHTKDVRAEVREIERLKKLISELD